MTSYFGKMTIFAETLEAALNWKRKVTKRFDDGIAEINIQLLQQMILDT